jgi:hypothetical protein
MNTRSTSRSRNRQGYRLGLAALAAATLTAVALFMIPATQASATYKGNSAASWAIAHAKDPQIASTECTWFVSQALWAGGLPQSTQWNATATHSGGILTGTLPGTLTAWVVPDLVSYLEGHFAVTWTSLGNMSTNAVPEAAIGDIIVYDWHNNGTMDHMAIITRFASGDYPLVSEMGQFDWTGEPWDYLHHPSSSYAQRGWTWSQGNGEWLETEFGGSARAYLLHFDSSPPFAKVGSNPAPTSPPATAPPTTSPPPTSPGTTPSTNPPTASTSGSSTPAPSPPATSTPATSPPVTSSPTTNAPASSPPATSPPVTSPPTTSPPVTVQEQEGHNGANTFSNYSNASGEGTAIGPGQWVAVTCRVYDPSITSASPDGYWYLIASSPWNNQYWAVANTFMNGDVWGCWTTSSCTHNTDFDVPTC